MPTRIARSLVAVLLVVAAGRGARATVMLPLDLDALVDRAQQIALARVEKQEARWTSDGGVIYTEVTLRVTQAWKGAPAPGATLLVHREGGVVGKVGMRVFGAAGFSDGEEVLVFLEQRGASLYTVGMSQGKMRVETVAGRRVVIRATPGLAWVGGRPPATAEPAVRPLSEVIDRITARLSPRTR